MSFEPVSEHASLQELQRTPIDTVLQSIDDGLVHLPTYRELYHRWERQHWQVRDIDFRLDALQWQHMSGGEQDHLLGVISAFFQGEASVTDALAPYVIAMPDEETRFYVTTQLVDETRHTIFFDRFFREVLHVEEGRIEERLQVAQQFMNGAMRSILLDALLDMARRLRQEPENRETLVEGVTLYHILTEGTMGLAGQRHLLEYFRAKNLFPGFRGGFTAVARDESRHVLFGVTFLREMIQQDAAYAEVVRRALATYAPLALDALAPTEGAALSALDPSEDPWQPQRYGYRSLSKKLKVIGLTADLSAFVAPPALV